MDFRAGPCNSCRMFTNAVKAALMKLPFSVRYELFYQAAQTLGVTGYLVDGSSGQFAGPVRDQSVIKAYMRDGDWSHNIVELFSSYFHGTGGGTFIVLTSAQISV